MAPPTKPSIVDPAAGTEVTSTGSVSTLEADHAYDRRLRSRRYLRQRG